MTEPQTDAAPLSPDFADHPAGPEIAGTATDGETLTVTWADGLTGRFNRFYLRENEVGPAISPVTRESQLDIGDMPEDLRIEGVTVSGVAVTIGWAPDGHRSRHHRGWLRFVAEGLWRPRAALPERQTWDAASMPEPLSFDGPAALSDDGVLRDWLTAAERFGLARLRGLPPVEDSLLTAGRRIGTIRASNFGYTFIVESKPDPDSNAYTSVALSGHTDLGTRELQPGLQILFCMENSSTGGESTMVDGFRIADELKTRDPAAWKTLTTKPWLFTNRHVDTDYRWSGPIIELNADGSYKEIRNTSFLRAEPDMAPGDVAEGYRAFRAYMALAADPAFVCRTPFRAGDLVLFDNRRILHGRAAFDPQSGVRRLAGCYLDTDEIHSRLRVLARRARAAHGR